MGKKEDKTTRDPSVLIAIPNSSGWCHEHVALSRMAMVDKTKETLPHVDLQFALIAPFDIAEGRWELAKRAVELGSDFLFFVDSDMILPNYALLTLLHMMEAPDVGIATGVGFTNMVEEPRPSIYMQVPDGSYVSLFHYHKTKHHIIEIDACGMYCALIRTEIFQQIAEAENSIIEWYNMFKPNGASEDISFCKRARDVGRRIFVHRDVKCGHFPRWPTMIDEGLYFQRMEEGVYDKYFKVKEKPDGAHVP